MKARKPIIRKAKKLYSIATAPMIKAEITLESASVETTGKALSILCKALGEDVATKWHQKYLDKYEKITNDAWEELKSLTAKAVKAKNEQ